VLCLREFALPEPREFWLDESAGGNADRFGFPLGGIDDDGIRYP
jgi:hypothetical protein